MAISLSSFGPYPLIRSAECEVALGNLIPNSAEAAGELVAGRCDNDTTHQLRRHSGPRLRQLLIIDGSQGPGLASNCITGHFSIAICESCGDVCRVAINRHCPERQTPSFSRSLALLCFLSFCVYEGWMSSENIFFQCSVQQHGEDSFT